MNILSVCALAVVTVILAVMLRKKNGEISVMLCISCGVIILLSALSGIASVIETINLIVASSGINSEYVVILLKVTGICLVTEFAANVCRDSGSQSLAGNVSFVGKIMVTIIALPLYEDILNTILSLMQTS